MVRGCVCVCTCSCRREVQRPARRSEDVAEGGGACSSVQGLQRRFLAGVPRQRCTSFLIFSLPPCCFYSVATAFLTKHLLSCLRQQACFLGFEFALKALNALAPSWWLSPWKPDCCWKFQRINVLKQYWKWLSKPRKKCDLFVFNLIFNICPL